jgi:hypothetical protein
MIPMVVYCICKQWNETIVKKHLNDWEINDLDDGKAEAIIGFIQSPGSGVCKYINCDWQFRC